MCADGSCSAPLQTVTPPTRSFRASLAAMTGLCLVFMLTTLNTSVVGTAMPRIVAELVNRKIKRHVFVPTGMRAPAQG